MMSDDDLIRRGDALNACRASEHRYEAHDAIDALPAVTQPAPDAAADRIEELEAKLEKSEARSEVLEELAMDVAADLYDGVAAHKIDQRIMDVIKELDKEEEDQ